MKRRFLFFLCIVNFALFSLLSSEAAAPPAKDHATPGLVTGKQADKVHLDVLFNGGEMLLFGFADRAFTAKDNLMIEVTGPKKAPSIYRNIYLGLLNLKIFYDDPKNIPAFYGLYDIRERIGGETARIGYLNAAKNLRGLDEEARNSVIEYLKKNEFYQVGAGQVRLTADQLFQLQIRLPESAPAGEYEVRYRMIVNGALAPVQYDRFTLEKVGTELALSDLARKKPLLNALAVALCAILFTHAFNAIFRKI